MILYTIRHGRTDFNEKHILQGLRFDEPLNKTGETNIRNVAPKIPQDCEVIYCSDLKRVRRSADIINEVLQKDLKIFEELREREFGDIAGHRWDQVENGEDLQIIDRKQEYNYRPFGGESVDDVKVRVQRFLDTIKNSHHEKVLVVTSSGIIRVLYLLLQNKIMVKIPNASVHMFEL